MIKDIYERLELAYGMIRYDFGFSFNNPGKRASAIKFIRWTLDDLHESYFSPDVCDETKKGFDILELAGKIESGIREMVTTAKGLPINWHLNGGHERTEKDTHRADMLAYILSN